MVEVKERAALNLVPAGKLGPQSWRYLVAFQEMPSLL